MSFPLRVIKKHGKYALMQISQTFETLEHVDCQSMFWNNAFQIVVYTSFDSL